MVVAIDKWSGLTVFVFRVKFNLRYLGSLRILLKSNNSENSSTFVYQKRLKRKGVTLQVYI
jgi:hypothetical protein